ncbi:alpha-elapitoxin-As2a-like [Morone saxatilis]|uniref:alpha-elapitoxin-As2a-like n=1 Tax=Morone saxatilis TaxID=34816 RepID=UPI0015E23E10|nr:alpha-elapitoxin-As2a-like [Morone saxatilis]
MGRIVLAVVAVIASFMLVDSLNCNKCSYGLLGFCISSSEITCSTNTSVCFTGKASFSSISVGFNTQGCREPAGCNATVNSTLLGVDYTTKIDCCSTDKCNPVQISGAPSSKMTLTAALGVAVLASLWGSML